MRIAFFTDTFLPQINGVVVYVTEIARHLADRGHHIYIIAPKSARTGTFVYPNVTVLRRMSVPAPFYGGFKFTLPFDPFLLKFAIDKKIDVIHFHTPLMLGMQAFIIARILNLPLIGTFHTFFAHPHYLKHIRMNNWIMEKLAWKWSNTYYNRCDLVICPSEGTKAELIAKGCKRPLRVIYNGVDSSVFDNSKSSAVRKALNQGGKLVLFVGRLAHEKNISYLLDCFAMVLRKVPSAKLVIVGDGPQEADIRARIRLQGVGKSVVLMGKIEHEKLVKSGIFGACDVFVNASTTETGPLTVIEAQANGLVCVSVRGKGMSLIKDNVNGYLAKSKKEFADAVVKLLTEEKTYARMRRATLREVRMYELSRTVAELEKAYHDVQAGVKDE
ncbi:glycosyltransferase [Candidatus Woesearchaeota archaeon]|nr:glycosyltransferase [Candidatus Woesearchaeota archaeon]